MYSAMWGASREATTPEMPAPSSRAVVEGVRMERWVRKLGVVSHEARWGVTFQRTGEGEGMLAGGWMDGDWTGVWDGMGWDRMDGGG